MWSIQLTIQTTLSIAFSLPMTHLSHVVIRLQSLCSPEQKICTFLNILFLYPYFSFSIYFDFYLSCSIFFFFVLNYSSPSTSTSFSRFNAPSLSLFSKPVLPKILRGWSVGWSASGQLRREAERSPLHIFFLKKKKT